MTATGASRVEPMTFVSIAPENIFPGWWRISDDDEAEPVITMTATGASRVEPMTSVSIAPENIFPGW